jgi:sarcosine oxidase subunit gamma
MNGLAFAATAPRDRFGLKGPGAAGWLAAQGLPVPAAPNTWAGSSPAGDGALLVARIGMGEFFIEDCAGGGMLRGIEPEPTCHPPGVYPVLREDAAFVLSGGGAEDVLAQVCNVNFAELELAARPVVMSSMIGVSVLVVAQQAAAERWYRIWCDPTFGPYLGVSVGRVVIECGGNYRGVAA